MFAPCIGTPPATHADFLSCFVLISLADFARFLENSTSRPLSHVPDSQSPTSKAMKAPSIGMNSQIHHESVIRRVPRVTIDLYSLDGKRQWGNTSRLVITALSSNPLIKVGLDFCSLPWRFLFIVLGVRFLHWIARRDYLTLISSKFSSQGRLPVATYFSGTPLFRRSHLSQAYHWEPAPLVLWGFSSRE